VTGLSQVSGEKLVMPGDALKALLYAIVRWLDGTTFDGTQRDWHGDGVATGGINNTLLWLFLYGALGQHAVAARYFGAGAHSRRIARHLRSS